MINTNIEFDEFVTRLKDKFGFRRKTRCKIQDEDGDGMISVSDQEDLDMAISTSKKNARRDRCEFGKLEVSFSGPLQLILTISYCVPAADMLHVLRFGSKKSLKGPSKLRSPEPPFLLHPPNCPTSASLRLHPTNQSLFWAKYRSRSAHQSYFRFCCFPLIYFFFYISITTYQLDICSFLPLDSQQMLANGIQY